MKGKNLLSDILGDNNNMMLFLPPLKVKYNNYNNKIVF